jgi:iron(III) transport system ATP-binding protein
MSVSITVDQAGKRFGGVTALHPIDLSCAAGSFTAILGPSGCGKTTLLRLLAGFEVPSSGRILFDEAVVSSPQYCLPPESRNTGMVFQSFALWPHMSVIEHVLFALRYRGRGREGRGNRESRESKEKAVDILNSMELEALADRRPAELSGGQRQRVSLARAIAGGPGTLLMDEPLSSLDAELRVSMRHVISSVHQRHGATVVYVTHDQEEAMAMASRIVVMNCGRIEQIGTPAEVYTAPASPFVARFVSKANLVRGRWEGDFFYPEKTGGARWPGHKLDGLWREKGIYPVRPEQFTISPNGDGLRAEVESIQYQGREIHCILRSGDEMWKAYWPSSVSLECGQAVRLAVKN